MPLRRLNLDTNTLDGQRTPSSSTTTTPVSEQHHPSFAHDQIQIEMPPTTAPIPPPHMLGPPTSQAVSALAQAMQSGITRRLFQNVQNEHGAYDEDVSERSQLPSDRQHMRRTASIPRNGSIGGDHSIHMSPAAHPPLRRNSHVSSHIRGSVSNVSELAAGPLVLYNPHEMMFPPPPLSRAPSIGWLPQPPPVPPQFPIPYYYGHNAFAIPMPLDPKAMRKAMKQARKIEKKRRLEADLAMNNVGCSYYCCDGVAQLLWSIILITLLGFVLALILAIFVL